MNESLLPARREFALLSDEAGQLHARRDPAIAPSVEPAAFILPCSPLFDWTPPSPKPVCASIASGEVVTFHLTEFKTGLSH
jgi:hypothetical protein